MKTKTIIWGALIIFSIVIMINFVSADFWGCFTKGDKIDFCNPNTNDRTCGSTLCKYCMKNFNETRQCYNQGNFNLCNSMGGECGVFGGGNIDGEPPILTLNDPINNSLQTKRRILVDFTVDEESDVYYLDLINGRGRWTRVCRDCREYSRTRSFKEGYNHLRIRATDVVGNEEFQEISFLVDSKKPKISKTGPKRGFANGLFEVRFKEENPEKLELHYGNIITGFRVEELDLGTSCYKDRKKTYCEINVDLEDYDEQEIEYWFELEDIVGNFDDSRHINIGVDTTFPIINSIEKIVDGTRVEFTLNITELNFDEAEYIDNSALRPRWRRLCSRLKEGMCERRIVLKDEGEHKIDIQVIDDAGNIIGESVVVEII